jgi:hypothetical protein
MPRLLQPQDQAVPQRETVARRPVRPGERALAPDLARCCMLLVWAAIAAGLVAWTVVPAVAAVVSGDLGLLGQAPTEPTTVVYASGQDNALADARTRIGTWLFVTLGGTLSFRGHAVMLLGFWTAIVGLTIGWLGGLPAATIRDEGSPSTGSGSARRVSDPILQPYLATAPQGDRVPPPARVAQLGCSSRKARVAAANSGEMARL